MIEIFVLRVFIVFGEVGAGRMGIDLVDIKFGNDILVMIYLSFLLFRLVLSIV